ncbi:epoxide hydrolase family protein [Sphingosinicella microcystinivorans]|uniref:Epoxide hydrolase n=1 Tax=Sphingosinicella microcystinivorans TaxID=335406 RepID=A0AAD1D3X7_SPHMI|nr:epoxide hydrolase family protein [Sphingosinicella microcystinivorans]RKS89128.1 microsomal epoxide hydrolase [Sphingosinicella microcystinivorans]BBE32884.1 epoxide hydrolase [Sphingosinicella microcystinivorans]
MIAPFEIPVEPEEAEWVRRRVEAFRFFEEPEDAGWRYGANRAYLERLRDYWLTVFDWPDAVARLNRHPHVRAEVLPGFRLHCIHKRSSRPDAKPLLIAHGWPGSILEFDAIIERLAEPEDGSPAFHVVAPSLPGYAWSDKPKSPIGPRGVAKLYDSLMGRLGYDSYIYQGGDWGSVIGGWIGLDSARVTAVHLNGFGLRPADMQPTTEEEALWLKWALQIRATETAYLQLQGTKPQSLAYAMMDSPMGIAAWLAEKFCGWSDVGTHNPAPPFSMDQMLTNIMIYLSTRSFHTATWIYRGLFDEGGFTIPDGRRIEVPTGVAAFPHDLLAFPPRAMAERGYNIVHWTKMPRGGHFASLEEPELFLADLRKFVAAL